jgi:hypothetical protein
MNYDYEQTEFSKSVLSGLFAGIIATFASLAFNMLFRSITQFNPSAIINVSSIIIGSVLILTIAGVIFYFFQHYIKGGSILFRIFFLLLTAIATYFSMRVQRSTNAIVSKQFTELLSGIVLISGSFIIFYIPYLFNNEHIYS